MIVACTVFVAGIGLLVMGSIGYLLILLCAAALAHQSTRRRKQSTPQEIAPPALRLVVLVPAHNEEIVLAATLESLAVQDYPAALREVVVVADNCTDNTAQIAKGYGVTVLERSDFVKRGKGYALEWAIAPLMARPEPPDAVLIVDADTSAAPDFVSVLAARLAACNDSNGCALQGRYGVLNSGAGWRATLMAAAFDLINHVRPLGSDRLGLSVTLKGNGMAFTRETLQAVRWQGDSLTEDLDYSLALMRQGIHVRYVPEARVLAQMPVTVGQAASQRARWEGGRYRLLRERALPLLFEGLRRPRLVLLDAALGLLIPPLAELTALLILWGGLILLGSLRHLLLGPVVFTSLFALSALGFLGYVFGGLWIAGARRDVYAALFRAPLYIVWKFALYAKGLLRRKDASSHPPEWIRTEREPLGTPPVDPPRNPTPDKTVR